MTNRGCLEVSRDPHKGATTAWRQGCHDGRPLTVESNCVVPFGRIV